MASNAMVPLTFSLYVVFSEMAAPHDMNWTDNLHLYSVHCLQPENHAREHLA
jgi:hypothetical protein